MRIIFMENPFFHQGRYDFSYINEESLSLYLRDSVIIVIGSYEFAKKISNKYRVKVYRTDNIKFELREEDIIVFYLSDKLHLAKFKGVFVR